jgi:hypothetical protein
MRLRPRDPPPWLDEPVPTEHPAIRSHRQYEIGDCWYASPDGDRWTIYPDGPEVQRQRITLAPEHRGARPIVVVLPYGDEKLPWCLHTGTSTAGSGWTVSGGIEGVPDITVHPSILFRGSDADGNLVERWHGWVRDGRLVGA